MGEEKTEPRFELREKPVVASQFSRSKAQWGHSDSHTEHVRGAVVAGQYSEPAHTDQGTSDSICLSRTVELYVSRTDLRCTCGLECVKSNSNYMDESAEAGWGGTWHRKCGARRSLYLPSSSDNRQQVDTSPG